MNRWLIFIFTILFSSISFADTGKCKSLYRNAEITMDQRQDGVPLTFQIEVIEKIHPGSKNDPLKNLLFVMVEEAYEQPKYSKDELRKEATQEFAAKWYLRCMSSTKSK